MICISKVEQKHYNVTKKYNMASETFESIVHPSRLGTFIFQVQAVIKINRRLCGIQVFSHLTLPFHSINTHYMFNSKICRTDQEYFRTM